MKPTILAIESSCDDTSVALLHEGRIASNIIVTQVEHAQYGGVVPEVASRAHQLKILPGIEKALLQANVELGQIDAIAFTKGPGLLGSLLVGVTTAKALSLGLDIPLIEVHHMHAHVLAHFIDKPYPKLPFLCLTVSGGHTQIVLVEDPLNMTILGQTIDDAAGEAFDKTGKMLGLPYPAGPHMDKLAQEGKPIFSFSTANIDGLDFSYSGLKTSVLYYLQKQVQKDKDFINNNLNDLCSSIQSNIVTSLLTKLQQASSETGVSQVAIAGGVSANSQLRSSFLDLGDQLGWQCYIPKFEYCTDNAAMVAQAGLFKYQSGIFADQSVKAQARLPF